MDTIEVLFENIIEPDIDSVKKIVHYYSKENEKIQDIFINYCIIFFCKHYLNKNIWFLQKFIEYVDTNILDVCILLCYNEYKENIKFLDDDKIDSDIIDDIISKNTNDYDELYELQEVLKPKYYTLFSMLYYYLDDYKNLHISFIIIQYLLESKSKDIFCKKIKDTIVDILFKLIFKYIANNNIISKHVILYIQLCYKIFLLKCKKNDKMERINLLLYSFYVLIKKNIRYQEIDIKIEKEPSLDKYLFVYIPCNYALMDIVKKDKNIMKSYEKKIVKIDKCPLLQCKSNYLFFKD